MKPNLKTITWLTIFSMAMGYLETSVVVYLRKMYYPDGFRFPLIPISHDIAIIEFWREAATIIMLIGAGIISGKNAMQRFSFFLYSFAIWDIFYYVFLKILLNWPESLFTWDILFLIPVPWVGPVIAPCLLSLTMIGFTFLTVYYQKKGKYVQVHFVEWILFIFGSMTTIISFMWDYIVNSENVNWTLSGNQNIFDDIKKYIPHHFNWALFGVGEGIVLLAIYLIYKRINNITTNDI